MKKFFVFLLVLVAANGFSQQLKVNLPQVESKTNPPGVDVVLPKFSWQLQSTQRAVVQTAYRVLVADKIELLQKNIGNSWDSKKINSGQSIQIVFGGNRLKSATTYFWKVQVWNNKGQTAYGDVASFTTGLFTTKDWDNARWIGYEDMPDSLITVPGIHAPDIKAKLGAIKLKQRVIVPMFRKSFVTDKKITAATIFVSGLGQYEMTVNGEKIGNSFLAPGWTHYDKRVLYNTYDVTANIKTGDNAIGVIVGNGFFNISRERYIKLAIAYGYPKMICKMIIRYADGTTKTIVSDNSWKVVPSPITFSSIYGGEDYDANLEQEGWDKGGFNDAAWKNALMVKAPKGILEAEADYPVKVNDILQVKKITQPKDSVYMYDFGQNLSGIVELKVKGKKGQVVKLTPAELLNDNMMANQSATGKPNYFSYILKGDGIETWRPRFTYTGFRYVQVEGGAPDSANTSADVANIIHIASLHTGNSEPQAGKFSCSNELFNKINGLIKWAIKSNLQSVVTDCPHREKLSWLEQDYLMGGSIKANYNVYHLYKKLVHDMIDAQTVDGLVPDITPEYAFFDDKGFGFRDSPEWGSASVIVPWLVYKWYGDRDIIEETYPMMTKYIAYLQKRSVNNILDYGLGDWYDYGPAHPGVAQLTPKALTATAIYCYDVQLVSSIAKILGKKTDVVKYAALGVAINYAFNDKFFNAQTKVYSTGSQTAMAMPLSLGLVAAEDKDAVKQNMIDSITVSGKKLTAGDIGFHFLIQALQDGGASQLIYDMNYRDDVPGYGYQLKKGATALTESWPALADVSNNHLMLGHIMQWFYEGLGGINQADDSYGYKKSIIKPEVVGDISFVNASQQTPYGIISSQWKKDTGSFILDVEIPVNTTVVIYLPAAKGDKVTEQGKLISTQKECRILGIEHNRLKLEAGSGKYHFEVQQKIK